MGSFVAAAFPRTAVRQDRRGRIFSGIRPVFVELPCAAVASPFASARPRKSAVRLRGVLERGTSSGGSGFCRNLAGQRLVGPCGGLLGGSLFRGWSNEKILGLVHGRC